MPLMHSRDLGHAGQAAKPLRQTRHGAKRAASASVCENTDATQQSRPTKQLKSHHEPAPAVVKQSVTMTSTTTTNVRQTRNALSNISNATQHHPTAAAQNKRAAVQHDAHAVTKAHKDKLPTEEKTSKRVLTRAQRRAAKEGQQTGGDDSSEAATEDEECDDESHPGGASASTATAAPVVTKTYITRHKAAELDIDVEEQNDDNKSEQDDAEDESSSEGKSAVAPRITRSKAHQADEAEEDEIELLSSSCECSEHDDDDDEDQDQVDDQEQEDEEQDQDVLMQQEQDEQEENEQNLVQQEEQEQQQKEEPIVVAAAPVVVAPPPPAPAAQPSHAEKKQTRQAQLLASANKLYPEFAALAAAEASTVHDKAHIAKHIDPKFAAARLAQWHKQNCAGANQVASQGNSQHSSDCFAAYNTNVYEHLLQSEGKNLPPASYLNEVQTDLTFGMRSILLDWLVEVAIEYSLQQQTLYLTVSYIDRYLARVPVSRNKLQLVGITAMLLAAKYWEIYPPSIDDFVYISDHTYNRQQVVDQEASILINLRFGLTVPTVFDYSRRLIRLQTEHQEAALSQQQKQHQAAAQASGSPAYHGSSLAQLQSNGPGSSYALSKSIGALHAASRITLLHVDFLCELFMCDPASLAFRPSIIGAAAIYLSQWTQGTHPVWSSQLRTSSHYNVTDLASCASEMYRVYEKAMKPEHSLKAVKEKYSHTKTGKVALNFKPLALPKQIVQ